jgi:mannose-1-phosphate guanylyltransferase
MIVVIIAGGSGTRLWPLSTQNYPKHLLALTNEKSLLQNTLERVKHVTSLNKVYVVTDASHAQHVVAQMPELDKSKILVEPARRGTASCVALALSSIMKDSPDDEPVAFFWADHHVRNVDGFALSVLRAGELARETGRLVFIGIEPSYQATGLNYIEVGGALPDQHGAFALKRFTEKPDAAQAKQYIDSGKFLWNSGYLVGMRSTLMEHIRELNPGLYEALKHFVMHQIRVH